GHRMPSRELNNRNARRCSVSEGLLVASSCSESLAGFPPKNSSEAENRLLLSKPSPTSCCGVAASKAASQWGTASGGLPACQGSIWICRLLWFSSRPNSRLRLVVSSFCCWSSSTRKRSVRRCLPVKSKTAKRSPSEAEMNFLALLDGRDCCIQELHTVWI